MIGNNVVATDVFAAVDIPRTFAYDVDVCVFMITSIGPTPLRQILFVAYLFHPFDDLAVERLRNGDMRHRGRWRGAMPMSFIRRTPNYVARSDFDFRLTLTLYPFRTRT